MNEDNNTERVTDEIAKRIDDFLGTAGPEVLAKTVLMPGPFGLTRAICTEDLPDDLQALIASANRQDEVFVDDIE